MCVCVNEKLKTTTTLTRYIIFTVLYIWEDEQKVLPGNKEKKKYLLVCVCVCELSSPWYTREFYYIYTFLAYTKLDDFLAAAATAAPRRLALIAARWLDFLLVVLWFKPCIFVDAPSVVAHMCICESVIRWSESCVLERWWRSGRTVGNARGETLLEYKYIIQRRGAALHDSTVPSKLAADALRCCSIRSTRKRIEQCHCTCQARAENRHCIAKTARGWFCFTLLSYDPPGVHTLNPYIYIFYGFWFLIFQALCCGILFAWSIVD